MHRPWFYEEFSYCSVNRLATMYVYVGIDIVAYRSTDYEAKWKMPDE